MRFASHVVIATIAATGLLACSPEPAPVPGTPGAGVQVAIAGVTRDSIGYAIKVQITNRDTAAIEFGTWCDWGIETRANGGEWAALDLGPCAGVGMSLAAATAETFSMTRLPLVSGNDVRVVFGWSYFYQPRGTRSTTSAPASVGQ